MKRYLKCLTGALPLLAALGIQLIVAVFLNIAYMVVIGIQTVMNYNFSGAKTSAEYGDILEKVMSKDATYLISVIAIIVCGIVFFFWYRHEIRGEVRGKLNILFTVKNVFLFILLGIGGQFFISGILGLIEPFFSETFEKYAETMESLLGGNVIIVLLLLVFVAPVAEELIFRGMVLHKTNRILPFLGANIFQAVLFGIYHGNIIQGIYATLLGFLLGLVYRKFKTIYAPIFLHMMFNSSSLLMMLLPDASYLNFFLVAAGAVLTGITIFLLMPFNRDEDQLPIIEFAAKAEELHQQ